MDLFEYIPHDSCLMEQNKAIYTEEKSSESVQSGKSNVKHALNKLLNKYGQVATLMRAVLSRLSRS